MSPFAKTTHNSFQFLIKGYKKTQTKFTVDVYSFQFLIKGYQNIVSGTALSALDFQFLIKGYR